jgi:hypothetical protein
MKSLVGSTFVLLLLTGVAFSQESPNANRLTATRDAEEARAAAAHKKEMELDAYKAAKDKTKAKSSASDPWGTVRPANTPATSHQ